MKKSVLLIAIAFAICALTSCAKSNPMEGTRWVASANNSYIILEFSSSTVKAYSADKNYIRNNNALGGFTTYHQDGNRKVVIDSEFKIAFLISPYKTYTISDIFTYDYPNSISVSSDPHLGSFRRIKE